VRFFWYISMGLFLVSKAYVSDILAAGLAALPAPSARMGSTHPAFDQLLKQEVRLGVPRLAVVRLRARSTTGAEVSSIPFLTGFTVSRQPM